MNLRLLLVVSTISLLTAVPALEPVRCVGGEAPAAVDEAPTSWRFRRVYAPADQLKDWPVGNARYLPMEPAEFERLLGIAQAGRAKVEAALAARPVTAVYQARLVGDRLCVGRASVQVEHSAKGPVLLPLHPCGLAIGKASWGEGEQPAGPLAGDTPGSDAPGGVTPGGVTLGLEREGKLVVLVERSDRLEFDWSLAGHRDAAGMVSFPFELPSCPTNCLTLDVPEDVTLTADPGVVTPIDGASDGLHRWQIELGGHHVFELRVLPAGAVVRSAPPVPVRESVQYHFSLRGVEVSADLNLDVSDEPLRQITLSLDPELQLISARCGKSAIPWSVIRGGGAQPRVVLTLPDPIVGTECVLRLRAFAPLKTDQLWQLPRIRAEGTFWQEGKGTLLVPAPLLLTHIEPVQCRQSGTGPLSAPQVGESIQFQCFSPDATARVVVSRRPAAIQLTSGTAVKLSGRGLTAEVRAAFRIADGLRFALEASVEPWLIDSVESVPADAMEDWKLAAGGRKLQVRLAKAITPQRPLMLKVTARRLQSPLLNESPESPWAGRLRIDDLLPLDFDLPEPGRQLVAVDVVGPYRLKLSGGGELRRIDSRSFDAAEMELFAELPRGLCFVNDAQAADLQVGLESEPSSYSATLRTEATAGGGTLQENFLLHCVPESARVDRVIVHLSRRRDVPLRWTLGTEDGRQLSARRLSMDEQVADGWDPDTETWELTLRHPRSEPFDIRGTRQSALARDQALSLVSLSGATQQRGTLVVRSFGPKAIKITNRGLVPIPAESVPLDRCQTARATYRYDPSEDLAGSRDVGVTISSVSEVATQPAWVWNCHIESRYQPDASGRHLATYRLQSSGAGTLRLRWPPEADLQEVREVWIDGRRVVWRSMGAGLSVELPPAEKFPTVSVHFATRPTRLGVVGSLLPPLPVADLPVLAQHWTVWLPPGYEAYDSDLRWQPIRAARPSWSQRLFGVLGRSRGHPVDDPLTTSFWVDLVTEGPVPNTAADGLAERLLEVLGAVAAGSTAGQASDSLTWAGLLGHSAVEALPVTLLMDRHAMARLALTPQASVRPAAGDDALARGASLLQGAQLALLVHSDVVLLTSQTDAALYRSYLVPSARNPVWHMLPGPLAEQLHEVAAGKRHDALVPLETWQREPPEPKVLWEQAGGFGGFPGDTCGWNAYRLTMSSTPSEAFAAPAVRLKFVHRQTMRLFGSVAFLLVVAVGWWKTGNRPKWSAAAAGFFGVAALLLPEAYVPIASGAVLGSLFCMLVGLIDPRRAAPPAPKGRDRQPNPPSTVSLASRIVITVVAVAAASLWCATARGGESPETPLPPDRGVYQVFIPVDRDKNPTGDRYHVPEPLHELLYHREAAMSEEPQGWLIGQATYRGVLSKQGTSEGLVVDELKASFDLQVLNPTARVKIPMRREETNLLPDGAVLDGQIIQPEWEADGSGLVLGAFQPGRYRLELSLLPTIRTAEVSAGFDLTIPRLATSRLELAVPPSDVVAGAPSVEVSSATGSVRFENEPPRVLAELGPTDRISVRWPGGAGTGGVTPAVDVEEYLWLKVRPWSVVLEARFKFKVVQGQVRQFQLAADPRLRLDRLEVDRQQVDKPETVPGSPQVITVRLPSGASTPDGAPEENTPNGQAVVTASFLLKDTSGVGNLRLPELEALGATSTRRWLAVSVDPALHAEQGPHGLEAVAVSDFRSNWDQTEAEPRVAFRLPPGKTDWSMASRPREPETLVDQTLVLSFDQAEVDLWLDAELETVAGYHFQYRLAVPPDLSVKQVSVLREDVECAARWSENRDGETCTITVFLTGPIDGRQRLSLHGRLPVSRTKRPAWPVAMPLPVVRVNGATVRSSTVKLYRRPSVLIEPRKTEGLASIEQTVAGAEDPKLGRLVGQFRVQETQTRPVVEIRPNRPEVEVDQLIRLQGAGAGWSAVFDCEIRLPRLEKNAGEENSSDKHGVVDEIRIRVPGSFKGPYSIHPPIPLEVVDPPGEPRQLIVRPRRAIDTRYRFRITGPLAPVPGDRPTVPRIELAQFERITRWIALPRQAQGQSIDWDMRGLRQAELPEGFALPSSARCVTYEVSGKPWQATLKAPDYLRSVARVRLADVHLAWQADGTCQGVVSFDLEPGRSADVPLWLPSEPDAGEYQLVQVSVAGMPVVPIPDRENRYRVPLGSEHLPQRIEVLFTGVLPEADGAGRRFDAPTLGRLPVNQTLWTVLGPPSLRSDPPQSSGAVLAWHHELSRLETSAALIKSAAAFAAENPAETFRWYWPWARRLAASRAALIRQLDSTVPANQAQAARRRIRAVNRQQSETADRLGMDNVWTQLASGTAVADDPVRLWHWSVDSRQIATRRTFSQQHGSLTLPYRRTETGRLQAGLLAAAVLIAFTALVVLGLWKGVLSEWGRRWPGVVGVAVGLAWWLWLWPSILGLGLVLVSLAVSLWSGRKHVAPPPGSSVISLRSVQG